MVKGLWKQTLADISAALETTKTSGSSNSAPPMPAGSVSRPDRTVQQMADDLSFIRRQKAAEAYGALFGILFLVGLVWWIFHS